MALKESDLKRHKMIREVEEEIRQLSSVLDFLEEDDKEEICQSLSHMFDIGFNYSQNLKSTEDEITKRVNKLRRQSESGKIDLTKYEGMAEEFDNTENLNKTTEKE